MKGAASDFSSSNSTMACVFSSQCSRRITECLRPSMATKFSFCYLSKHFERCLNVSRLKQLLRLSFWLIVWQCPRLFNFIYATRVSSMPVSNESQSCINSFHPPFRVVQVTLGYLTPFMYCSFEVWYGYPPLLHIHPNFSPKITLQFAAKKWDFFVTVRHDGGEFLTHSSHMRKFILHSAWEFHHPSSFSFQSHSQEVHRSKIVAFVLRRNLTNLAKSLSPWSYHMSRLQKNKLNTPHAFTTNRNVKSDFGLSRLTSKSNSLESLWSRSVGQTNAIDNVNS